MECLRIWGIEFSFRVKDFLDAWNVSVHKWLKYYVFLRMLDSTKRGGVQLKPILITFLVSAVWHGFYPGYYFFFVAAGLMDYTFKVGYKIWVLFDNRPWMPETLQKVILL